MFFLFVGGQAFSSDGKAVVERQQQMYRDRGIDISHELCEEIISMHGNEGFLRLAKPEMVAELSHIPVLRDRVTCVQLTSKSLAEFADTAHFWPHLKGINLNFCDLKAIPVWVLRLAQLERLSLSGNERLKIPDTVEFPPLLQVVDLDGCELQRVPAGLAGLRFLALLGLSFNPRELELPEWLVKRRRRGEVRIRGLWFGGE